MATVAQSVRVAQQVLARNRARGVAALNDAFRAGWPPPRVLDGTNRGELLALRIAPGLTEMYSAVAALYMPWQGKHFDAATASGYNLLRRDFYWVMRLMWPLYRGYVKTGGDAFSAIRAFTFRTSLAQGLADPDRQVLRLNYDLPGNSHLTVRRIVDELVQVDEGVFLGKAHVRWWWGTRQMAAFFLLTA